MLQLLAGLLALVFVTDAQQILPPSVLSTNSSSIKFAVVGSKHLFCRTLSFRVYVDPSVAVCCVAQ